ncbi:hypothetical protein H6769_04790 [Candidatus Peribacteria bacterium]|nr:hypothetical protein [Candidatus Peribacteria bacterium]
MIAGDLKYGRTTHSLSSLLSLLPNVELIFSSPKELQIPDKYISSTTRIIESLEESVLKEIDVLYMTRLQRATRKIQISIVLSRILLSHLNVQHF